MNEDYWYYYPSPYDKIDVYEDGGRESPVLDKQGRPFTIQTKVKLGFDLRPKKQPTWS